MKTQTNNQIFSEIVETGKITKKQMMLLKNRSNAQGRDLFNYEIVDNIDDRNIHCVPEFGRQGLNWLRSLLKKDGTPRAGVSLGAREIDAINEATERNFTFRGFYDAGRWGYHYYLPIYEVLGVEYVAHCQGEIIYIIG